MILVHRVNGGPLFINSDLIESIETTPDTVITLANGHRMLTPDPVSAIVDRISRFRASILVAADELSGSGSTADLYVLEGEGD